MAMVAVFGVVAGFIGAHALKRQALSGEQVAQIKMTNPRFFGRDTQGRAFMLTSRQAARDTSNLQRVLLQFPQVTLDVDGAHPSTLTADSGVYQEDTRILLLKGHVRADDAKMTTFQSDQAIVNTRTGVVEGPTAIAGQTPIGTVRSNQFEVHDKGDRVIYKGGVHARLNNH
jgi:lipopolysaccharide export system protein LptC